MIIDLTYPLNPDMPVYPGDPCFKIIRKNKVQNKKLVIKSAYHIYRIGSHHGTHIDMPSHMLSGGVKKVEDYKIEKFINKALIIDLSHSKSMKNKKREILELDIFDAFKGKNLKKISALIFHTGFDYIKDKKRFPYFTEKAARFIAKKFPKLNIIGIDSFSVDEMGKSFVHNIFLKRGILILETLTNLESLNKCAGKSKFTLYCVPILYEGGDASQTRAYAEVK